MYIKIIFSGLVGVLFFGFSCADEPKLPDQNMQNVVNDIEKVKQLIKCKPLEKSEGLYLVEMEISKEVILDEGTGFTLTINRDEGGLMLQNVILPQKLDKMLGATFYISSDLIKSSNLAIFFSVNNKNYYAKIAFIENDQQEYVTSINVSQN